MDIDKEFKARQIAFYILEGKTVAEAAEEFRVSKRTIERNLRSFAETSYENYYSNKTPKNAKMLKKAFKIQKMLNMTFFV